MFDFLEFWDIYTTHESVLFLALDPQPVCIAVTCVGYHFRIRPNHSFDLC